MSTSQRPSNSLNFTGRGPQITSKRFIQNPDGTFVLSYGLAHARLNMSRQAPIHVPVKTPPPLQNNNKQKHLWASYEEYQMLLKTGGKLQSIRTVGNITTSNQKLRNVLNAPVMSCAN